MKFYSTNSKSKLVDFRYALMKGLPSDNGLYMPSEIPNHAKLIPGINKLDIKDISFVIAKSFLSEDFKNSEIEDIIDSAISFDSPVVKIFENINILELFHGPTLAFKDFGARFMSKTMEKCVINNDKNLNILVATSGDTGSAVANGFYNIEGINVIILYPSKKVSYIQEKQLTTLGNNIFSLEVNGSFDDCQNLVKKAFLDTNITKKINLSSANSINIARLIPQSFYYFNAFAKLNNPGSLVVSVPSGNFGNLTAGILSKSMGLPIKKFIASTNANKAVPDFLMSGNYTPYKTIQTISNAMDVGDPSNIKRIMDLYNNFESIAEDIYSWSYVYSKYKYLLDPHSAVGYLGIDNYVRKDKNCEGLFLGTAHPCKFSDIIEFATNKAIEMPNRIKSLLGKEKKSIPLNNNYDEFSDYLLSNFE